MTGVLRTVEAVYEDGVLRPLEPIQDRDNQVYLVIILDLDAIRSPAPTRTFRSLRGKYRGFLSSADEFARAKSAEKALEH